MFWHKSLSVYISGRRSLRLVFDMRRYVKGAHSLHAQLIEFRRVGALLHTTSQCCAGQASSTTQQSVSGVLLRFMSLHNCVQRRVRTDLVERILLWSGRSSSRGRTSTEHTITHRVQLSSPRLRAFLFGMWTTGLTLTSVVPILLQTKVTITQRCALAL